MKPRLAIGGVRQIESAPGAALARGERALEMRMRPQNIPDSEVALLAGNGQERIGGAIPQLDPAGGVDPDDRNRQAIGKELGPCPKGNRLVMGWRDSRRVGKRGMLDVAQARARPSWHALTLEAARNLLGKLRSLPRTKRPGIYHRLAAGASPD
jgi:hypothetical protein